MESWSTEEDGFSFFHSMPHSFSARNGDGLNRVEIFDITQIPIHRSAISETTCLFDIFGEDYESSTISCSPVSGCSSKRDEEFTLADDGNNDSSDSYHTALCSEQLSDSSENFEDSKEDTSPPSPIVNQSELLTKVTDSPSPEISMNEHLSSEHNNSIPTQKSNCENHTSASGCNLTLLQHTGLLTQCTSSNLQSGNAFTTPCTELEATDYSKPDISSENRDPDPAAILSKQKSTKAIFEGRVVDLLSKPEDADSNFTYRCTTPSPTLQNISTHSSCSQSLSSSNTTAIALKFEDSVTSPKPCNLTPSPKPQSTAVSSESCSLPTSLSSRSISIYPETDATDQQNSSWTSLGPRDLPPPLSPGSLPIVPSLQDVYVLTSPRDTTPSPSPKNTSPSNSPRDRSISLTSRHTFHSSPTRTSPSPSFGNISPSISLKVASCSLTAIDASMSPNPKDPFSLSSSQGLSPSPMSRRVVPSPSASHSSSSGGLSSLPIVEGLSPSPSSRELSPSPSVRGTTPLSSSRDITPSPTPGVPSPSLSPRGLSPLSCSRGVSPSPSSRRVVPAPSIRGASHSPSSTELSPSPSFRGTSPLSSSRGLSPSPSLKSTTHLAGSRCITPSPTAGVASPLSSSRGVSPSPSCRRVVPSPSLRHASPSTSCGGLSPLPIIKGSSSSTSSREISPSPSPKGTSPLLCSRGLSPPPSLKSTTHLPCSRCITPSPTAGVASPLSSSRGVSPSPSCRRVVPSPSLRHASPSTSCGGLSPLPIIKGSSSSTSSREISPSPSPKGTSPLPCSRGLSPLHSLKSTTDLPSSRGITASPTPGGVSPPLCSRGASPSLSPRSVFLTSSPKHASPTPSPRDVSPLNRGLSPSSLRASPIQKNRKILLHSNSRSRTPSPNSLAITHSTKPHQNKFCSTPFNANAEFYSKDCALPIPTVYLMPPVVKCTGLLSITSESKQQLQTNTFNLPEFKVATTSSNCQTVDLLSETRTSITEDLAVEHTETHLYEPSDTDLLLTPIPEAAGRVHSSIAMTAAAQNSPKTGCSLQPHSPLLTGLPTFSSNQEEVKKTESFFKPASTLQKPNKDYLTAMGTSCTSLGDWKSVSREHTNQESREREEEKGKLSRGEDQWAEGEEGKPREASYREEQVDLSFSAKNRKAPASHNPLLTYREPQSGMIPRCYSECLLASQQQQQDILKSQCSQQGKTANSRNFKPLCKTTNCTDRNSVPDCSSEISSMGSEIDEEDNEVKWFNDLAFTSLSSPQVDYLDMYNSSHRSSTNVSQPSTEDSVGVNAWSAYADLRGSARLENDDICRQPSTTLPSKGLERAKHFDMGSFECVDVAMESREDARQGKRTVPKRQIQLKRRDTCESRTSESSEVISEGAPTQRYSKEILQRQHSTPQTMQKEIHNTDSDSEQIDSQKLQKSLSLEETYPKTKMASCFIKSTLSKTIQQEQKHTSLQVQINTSKIASKQHESFPAAVLQSSEEECNKDSILPSEKVRPGDSLKMQEGISLHHNQEKCFSFETHQYNCQSPTVSNLQSSTKSVPPSSNSGKSGKRSQPAIPFENHKKEIIEELSNVTMEGKNNTSSTDLQPVSVPSKNTNINEECLTKQQVTEVKEKDLFISKTEETIPKNIIAGTNKKSSVNKDSFYTNNQIQLEEITSPSSREESNKENFENKADCEAKTLVNVGDKVNEPIHKVRDVRKLVKNTYNLSFKATVATDDSVSSNEKDVLTLPSSSMQIECNAISRREGKEEQCCPGKGDNVLVSEETSLNALPPQIKEARVPKNDMINSKVHYETPTTQPKEVSPCSKSQPIGRAAEKPQMISTLLLLQEGQADVKYDKSAPPPLTLTTTSSNRSVSMLLKEKGFQADIGLCDGPIVKEQPKTKHVNRLEVPLQLCKEDTVIRPQKGNAIPPSPTHHVDELQEASPPARTVDSELMSPKSSGTDAKTIICISKNTAAGNTSHQEPPNLDISTTQDTRSAQNSPVPVTSSSPRQPGVTITSSYRPNAVPSTNVQQPVSMFTQEQTSLTTSYRSNQPETLASDHKPKTSGTFRQQPTTDKLRFYASEDPPSYDERESFSPLMLTGLQTRRPNRYQPGSQVAPCSCSSDSLLGADQINTHPFNLPPHPLPPQCTQDLLHPAAQPTIRMPRPLNYQPGSPQGSQLSQSQASNHVHQPTASSTCAGPLHHSEEGRQYLPCPRLDRQPSQQIAGVGPYSIHGPRGHSPNMPSMEPRPQYMCSGQGLSGTFSQDYEGTGSGGVLYPESSGSLGYGHSPRRVLLDPETGKYFYIEMPVQPLRKMLFDPESGQYVEVLIPQQTVSHSGLYPPSAMPYPSLHSPNMFSPPYMTYAVPPHSPGQAPPNPDTAVSPALHQTTSAFGGQAAQPPKPDPPTRPPLDPSYLESMYYIPTGMTASPNPSNPTVPDFYQKAPPSLPNSREKIS